MNGTQMLEKFRAPLHRLAVLMAVDLYGNVPDVEDRVGEARLALVEAASTFRPAPKRSGFGYFVRYALGQVAGGIRHGAGYAKETSAAETSFVDLSEVVVARLEELSVLGNEALWRLNNDTVVSTPKLIDLVMADKKRIKVALARLHDEGVEATEEQLPMLLLHALTELEEREMCPAPPWTTLAPSREPVAQGLGAITITRTKNGVSTTEIIEGDAYTELVNEASRSSVMWDDESIGVQYDDRSEAPRYDINPAADNLEPEECIPPSLWRKLQMQFQSGSAESQDRVIASLQAYWDRLDPDDPSKRRALFALAESVVSIDWDNTWKWGGVTPAVRVYGVLRRKMGLETPGGWEPPELPSMRSLRTPAVGWIGELQQHVWPSQYAGIQALALHRASPSQARAIEEAVYADTRF